MSTFSSGSATIHVDQLEPEGTGRHPALLVLHGSGGAASYWLERFAPALRHSGSAPHYFDKTGTQRATTETILDGRHFIAWLTAIQDAVTYVARRPAVDPTRIGVAGVSLGGYLAVALGIEDSRIHAVVELSGGVPLGWEDRVHSKMASTLILHGAQDRVVPVSEAHKLQKLLKERHVPHETEIFPNETHWFSPPAQFQLLLRCGDFVSRHLQPGLRADPERPASDAA